MFPFVSEEYEKNFENHWSTQIFMPTIFHQCLRYVCVAESKYKIRFFNLAEIFKIHWTFVFPD